MGRWEPDARGRLLRAAIELFADRGYDATTAAQIAERAGLTKTTLFRQFADKREIVFQGQAALIELAVSGVQVPPDGASALEMLRAGVLALCEAHSTEQRDIGRQLDPIVSASPELQERAIFKRSSITSAMETALAARLGDARQAGVLADIGIRAYYEGFASWIASSRDESLSDVVQDELASYEAVLRRMTAHASPGPADSIHPARHPALRHSPSAAAVRGSDERHSSA